MVDTKEWLSEEEAAAWLSVPVTAVRDAILYGQLPVLRVGEFVRVSRSALLDLARDGGVDHAEGLLTPAVQLEQVALAADAPVVGPARLDDADQVPQPLGMEWLNELHSGQPFDYRWPDSKVAHYDPVSEGRISLYGQSFRVRVGEFLSTVRGNPMRLAVLFDATPVCEFIQTGDGQGWASLIKPNGKSILRDLDDLPRLFARSVVRPYREATGMAGGPGVPMGYCVVVARDDLRSVVHQAAARWLGKNQRPLEPNP